MLDWAKAFNFDLKVAHLEKDCEHGYSVECDSVWHWNFMIV